MESDNPHPPIHARSRETRSRSKVGNSRSFWSASLPNPVQDKRLSHISQFLDLQTEVDHDGDCSLDESEDHDDHCECGAVCLALLINTDFLEHGLCNEDIMRGSAGFRDLHHPSPQEEHTELVRQAERIKQAYWLPFEAQESVDDQCIPGPILPSSDANWKLWRVYVMVIIMPTSSASLITLTGRLRNQMFRIPSSSR